MKPTNIIAFDSREKSLKKAREYVASVEKFMEESDQAVPLLLRTLKFCDTELKQKILLLLSGTVASKAARVLYDTLIDQEENTTVRHFASVQLCVLAGQMEDAREIAQWLIADLTHGDPSIRALAAFALGWEGNYMAAIPLIEKLYDEDSEVQQAAVNALSNLNDERILALMIERLKHGSLEQKRAILYNLGHFPSKKEQVIAVYRQYLHHADEELRLDSLTAFGVITSVSEQIPTYRAALRDSYAPLRELALERLSQLPPHRLVDLQKDIERGLYDSSGRIRRLAKKILQPVKSR